jgi:uncharacterized protein (DUF1015 family)
MPDIEAFRGIRYDLGHVGALNNVVAPPYDVISPAQQNAFYEQHPANVIRLILNRDEPGDTPEARYQRAGRFLHNWQSEGLLFTESEPALYVYHQQFTVEDQTFTRRGFMARVRLQRFGEGNIFPHEETMSGPKQDRLMLMQACRANLSPVFGLYPDPENAAQNLLEAAIQDTAPLEATDDLGVAHRLWTVTDPVTVAQVTRVMGPLPVFIADGHHRYETACNYRDDLAEREQLDATHPAHGVLMMCVSMDDPGMVVLPTHRLFRGLPPQQSADLIEKLGPSFACRLAGEGPEEAAGVWEEIEITDDQGLLGFYCPVDRKWVLAQLTDAGRARLAEVAGDHSPTWQSLGVSVLHRLVIETLLDGTDLPKPKYVHLVSEVQEELASDEFALAALVMPATLDHIRDISELQERMPAKSTYFYPKLLSGLVINPLY